MERKDVDRLFQLLGRLYGDRVHDSVTTAIWHEVFKPWTYAQVRDAVIQRARENRYYPDPSEITAYIPKPDEVGSKDEQARAPGEEDTRQLRWVRLYHDKLHEELKRVGLNKFSGGTGAEYASWRAMCQKAGIDFAAILNATRAVAFQGAR